MERSWLILIEKELFQPKVKGNIKKFAKVNSGLAIINKNALKYFNKNDYCFRSSLYKKMIKMRKAKNFNLKGMWYL